MYNTLTRLQNVFGFFTTVASCVAIAIALLSLVNTPSPQVADGSLIVRNVQVANGRPHYYSTKKEEYAHITFDLDIDISSLFTWNTKQVFLYIVATYPGSKGESAAKAIIWDAILSHPESPTHANQYVYPDVREQVAEAKKRKAKAAVSAKRKASMKNKAPAGSLSDKLAKAAAAEVVPSVAELQYKRTPGLLQLQKQRPKYVLTDPSGRIASSGNATLELAWNIQPWVGLLTWSSPSPSSSLRSSPVSSKRRWRVWDTWNSIVGKGARSYSFELPAVVTVGKGSVASNGNEQNLSTEKGGEANRGSPA